MTNAHNSHGSGAASGIAEMKQSGARGATGSESQFDVATSPQGSISKLLLPPSPGGRRWSWWLCCLLGWGGVSVLAMIALLRIFFHDATLLLTCLNAFSLYIYLPAYLILAWAIWQRRWLLTVVSGFAVACHVAWVAPDFMPARINEPTSSADVDEPVIKIFCGNVAAMNENRDGYLKEVLEFDADLVIFVEYRRHWHDSVVASSLARNYRYGTGITEQYLGEIAVFSKLPIKQVRRYWPTGRQVCDLDVEVGNDVLRLLCIHSPRPMNTPGNDYYAYWKETFPFVAKRSGPMIALGDFNATQHSKIHEAITASGLRSAHVDRGHGWAVTWPNGEAPAPPIRIDQAFLSPEVECLGIAEGEGQGSDHKPLVLDVRILGGRRILQSEGGQTSD